MKYSYKPDRNQSSIVATLKDGKYGVNYNVIVTSGIGNGFPDLVIPYNNFNFLWEVKSQDSAWSLTKSQNKLHPIIKKHGQIEIGFNPEQMHNYMQNFKCPYCKPYLPVDL